MTTLIVLYVAVSAMKMIKISISMQNEPRGRGWLHELLKKMAEKGHVSVSEMDPELLKGHQAFKKRATVTPVVEKKATAAATSRAASKPKKKSKFKPQRPKPLNTGQHSSLCHSQST